VTTTTDKNGVKNVEVVEETDDAYGNKKSKKEINSGKDKDIFGNFNHFKNFDNFDSDSDDDFGFGFGNKNQNSKKKQLR
jgi:hypothetical protein